jgi:hypothetical protein
MTTAAEGSCSVRFELQNHEGVRVGVYGFLSRLIVSTICLNGQNVTYVVP